MRKGVTKYLFIDEDDNLVEVEMTFEELMDRMDVMRCIEHEGKILRRAAEPADTVPVGEKIPTPFSKAYNRPLESISAGVHSSQAAEFNEAARRDGNTGVYYDPKTGKAHFESRGARRKELRRRGIRDNDGGYGDG